MTGIKVPQAEVYEHNRRVQEQKSEDGEKQYSIEKLQIEDWQLRTITGEELLELQTFVETSSTAASSYIFWKVFKKTRAGDIAQIAKECEKDIPEEAKPWVRNLIEGNYTEEAIEQAIKNNKIESPILVFPVIGEKERKEMGLLKMGNILDGNHRILDLARYLKDKDEYFVKNFRLSVYVGHINMKQYLMFNLYYLAEPFIQKAKKILGKESKEIDPKHLMNFFEKWYLLLDRIGAQTTQPDDTP
jgi:hypothetical protein